MASATRTTIWTDNQVLTASSLDAEFNHLLDSLNLINSDISASAGIVESKILFSGSGHGHTGGTDGKLISINRAFGFFIAGAPLVANDLSWNPISPEAMTAVKTWAYCKTAPTGSAVILSIYNITQAKVVGTVTIAQSATSGNSIIFTTAAIAQGDILRLDVTQADSNNVGANYSVVCEATQP
jgi:hypothetical protein